jgi:ferredoxin/flavodoxin
MKSCIYYFSGAGNSLAVARRIAKALGECELVPVAKALKEPSLLDCRQKTVGFIFPNYYMGIPNIVTNFMKSIKFNKPEYLFAVVTSGHPFGICLSQLNRILREKGIRLSYGSYIAMPDNYLPYFNITPENAQEILAKAGAKLERITKDIVAFKKKITEPTLIFGPLMRLWNRRWTLTYAERDKNFTVDDTCTSCGICEKVCPVVNVIMKGPRPEWKHHCEQCYACMHFCPVCAIQYGNTTLNKHRYHHPDASHSDISGQK